MTAKPESVQQYVNDLDPKVKKRYQELRKLVRSLVPDAEEVISYNIPTLKLNGRYVVYYAAWKAHLSIYPVPKGNGALAKKLEPFVHGAGTLKLSIGDPLPEKLIADLVAELVAINRNRVTPKKKKP